MKYNILIISREFGSGGRTIGKETAQRLAIPCYDGETIDRLAAEVGGYSQEYVRECSEYAPQGFFDAFLCRTVGLTKQDGLWILQRKIIRELAEKGPCVIVGHCADYILREREDCLNVFVHAKLETRAERIVQIYGEKEIVPQERLMLKDRRRAAFCKFYTDMEWGNMRNYHLTLDSGVLGIDNCVDILCRLM